MSQPRTAARRGVRNRSRGLPPADPQTGRILSKPAVRAYGVHQDDPLRGGDQPMSKGRAGEWVRAVHAERQRAKRLNEAPDSDGLPSSDAAYVGQVVDYQGQYVWVDLLDDESAHELVRFDVTEFPAELRAEITDGAPFSATPSGDSDGHGVEFRLIRARETTVAEAAGRRADTALLLAALRKDG